MCTGMRLSFYNLKQFIKNNWLFYSLYLTVILISAYYLLSYDKVTLHKLINFIVGNPFVDSFYKYFTHVGDGIFAVILGVLILIYNIRNGLYILLSYAIAGGLASLIKWSVNYTRPHHVFSYYKKHIPLNYVEGVQMIGEHSFPSGHATAAFSVFTALALISKNKFLKIIYFIIAFNAAFSRTYLSQHWLVDILAGSVIGVVIATFLYFVFYCNKKNEEKYNRSLIAFKP